MSFTEAEIKDTVQRIGNFIEAIEKTDIDKYKREKAEHYLQK